MWLVPTVLVLDPKLNWELLFQSRVGIDELGDNI